MSPDKSRHKKDDSLFLFSENGQANAAVLAYLRHKRAPSTRRKFSKALKHFATWYFSAMERKYPGMAEHPDIKAKREEREKAINYFFNGMLHGYPLNTIELFVNMSGYQGDVDEVREMAEWRILRLQKKALPWFKAEQAKNTNR